MFKFNMTKITQVNTIIIIQSARWKYWCMFLIFYETTESLKECFYFISNFYWVIEKDKLWRLTVCNSEIWKYYYIFDKLKGKMAISRLPRTIRWLLRSLAFLAAKSWNDDNKKIGSAFLSSNSNLTRIEEFTLQIFQSYQ